MVTFAAGGLATPADVGLLMELGCDGVSPKPDPNPGPNPNPATLTLSLSLTRSLSLTLTLTLNPNQVFVGSGIFKGENPAQRAAAMVAARTH